MSSILIVIILFIFLLFTVLLLVFVLVLLCLVLLLVIVVHIGGVGLRAVEVIVRISLEIHSWEELFECRAKW